MAISTERYHEIGFMILRNNFLGEIDLRHFVDLNENDIKKRVGRFAEETGVSREEALEFVKRFIDEICSKVKKVNDMAQQLSFK